MIPLQQRVYMDAARILFCMQMTSNASRDEGYWPSPHLHYISIHYTSLPGRVHNPNEVIFLAHMPLSVLGRRANFVLAFPRCIMRLQNFPDCPQCIHDLSGWVKRGWVVVVESCLRVVGRPIRPLFRLYSPPLPPFPPRIRAGGPTYQPPLFQASNTLT